METKKPKLDQWRPRAPKSTAKKYYWYREPSRYGGVFYSIYAKAKNGEIFGAQRIISPFDLNNRQQVAFALRRCRSELVAAVNRYNNSQENQYGK